MQYGAELLTYQRTNKINKEVSKRELDIKYILKVLLYFASAFFISRVLLINLMAPFGIAFLVSIIICGEEKIPLVAGGGTLLGYTSLYGNVRDLGMYLCVVGTVTALGYIIRSIERKKQLALIFAVIILEFTLYKFGVSKLTFGVSFFTAFFETVCIFPIYFIINYSIICFKDLKSRHLFTNEETMSMAVTISLVIAGTWGASIQGVSIRNILALLFVLIISYVKGATVGAACGVSIGVIVGMYSSNMIMFISVYGLCGLMTGVFKETGKWLSGLAYLVSFSIIKIYSNIDGQFKIIEAIISCIAFYIISNNIYGKLALELDWEKKQEKINENYVDKIRKILVGRLDNFSGVLTHMSIILENLADNDKLAMKSKSSALIENLADRVCSSCNMNSICWKRENYNTYTAFSELIQGYQEKKLSIPYELERKCVKRAILTKNTEEIVNNYVISEMWRSRLSEGRELLAAQISNMADSIGEIVEEFNEDVKFNGEAEDLVRRVLDKKGIKFSDILCFNNKNNRLEVKLSLQSCTGSQMCVKDVLPLLNEVLDKCMCIGDDGCSIDPKDNSCSITFEETPKYHIATYVARQCKDGESNNGDSFSYGKLQDGTYMTVISDGMGSGPEAEQESSAAVELIEKFTKAGFSKNTAINTVNSIMTLKFDTDEKFSTVDLNSVDLYSGEVDFMKVGAVASFIKGNNKVEVIKSKTLPIGVLDKVDIDTISKKVKNGDIIVMLSDGVLDYNNESVGKTDWIVDYLEKANNNNPKELTEGILSKALELSNGKVKDDMTVIVSKIYSLY